MNRDYYGPRDAVCMMCKQPCYDKRPESRYCSERCKGRAKRMRRRSRCKMPPIRLIPNCLVCNLTMVAKRQGAKYCSNVCQDKASRGRRRRDFLPAVERGICLQCGQTVTSRRGGRYCGAYCRKLGPNVFLPEWRARAAAKGQVVTAT